MAQVLAEYPQSQLEHFVRGVKDLLADISPKGRLAHIVSQGSVGALGLYPAWLGGFLKLLFPEIEAAVRRFMTDGSWQAIEKARQQGRQRALEAVRRLKGVMQEKDRRRVEVLVRREVIEPLTGAPG